MLELRCRNDLVHFLGTCDMSSSTPVSEREHRGTHTRGTSDSLPDEITCAEVQRALIEQMSEGAAVVDAHGVLHHCNPAFARLVDRNVSQLLGKSLGNLMTPSAHAETRQWIGLPGPVVTGLDTTVLTRSGSEVPVRLSRRSVVVDGDVFTCLTVAERSESGEVAVRTRESAVLRVCNQLLQDTLQCEIDEQVARTGLRLASELTGAAFGFIGELNANGRLDAIAISDPGWSACRMPKTDAVRSINDMVQRGIWATPIHTGQCHIINEPAAHPDAVDVLEGHPPLTAFLGVPVKYGDSLFGVIALANKDGGFTQWDANAVDTFSVVFAEVLMRARSQQELRKVRRALELNVSNRTAELDQRVKELNCLLRLSEMLVSGTTALDDVFEKAAALLPEAWLHTDTAVGRIEFDGRIWQTGAVTGSVAAIHTDIVVEGHKRGSVGVYYQSAQPQQHEGPFLREERALLDAFAEHLARAVIRERDRAEREAHLAQLTAILDSFPEIVYVCDPRTYEVLYVNQRLQELVGESFSNRKCYELFRGRCEPCGSCANDNSLSSPERRAWEYRNEQLGRTFYVTDQVIRWPDGRDVRLELAVDLTERKQIEESLRLRTEELARSNRELEQFAYVASHDLQEPLRMITSYLQLLQRRYTDQLDGDAHEFIHFAVDGAARMKVLIDDLLTFSRVDARGKSLVPTDCNTVLSDVLRRLGPAITEADARVTLDPLPTIDADETQLGQLFQNLITNAIKFRSAATPEVHVTAKSTESGWHFTVRDNGIGLDMKHAERVFTIFQRLHTRAEYPGTGIGLAVCRKIVERHGGRIWIKSSPGQGTTVHIKLPKREAGSRDKTTPGPFGNLAGVTNAD